MTFQTYNIKKLTLDEVPQFQIFGKHFIWFLQFSQICFLIFFCTKSYTGGRNLYPVCFTFEGKILYGLLEFYKYLKARFISIWKIKCAIISMFWNNYCYEKLITPMKENKSPIKARIINFHLASVSKVITVNQISLENERQK